MIRQAVAVLLLAALAAAVHVTVPPHQDECFFEYVDAGNKLTGSYEVLTGGLLDIDVSVYGPHGEAHYAVQRQKQGTFTAMAQASGLYRVCFSNRMSTLTEKVVAFSLHTGDDLYRDVAKKEHISPLENEVTQLADAVTAVEDEQKYMWARERAARDSELLPRVDLDVGNSRGCIRLSLRQPADVLLRWFNLHAGRSHLLNDVPDPPTYPAANESTNSRVVWFSVLELVTMIAIGGWQVFTLRRFFEQKGRV